MADTFMCIRIDDKIKKKYKKVCKDLGLKIAKQTENLIKNFSDIQEHNIKLLKEAQRE
jgi:antitoxin component of RelBE/YafQ-DinJ toxin-antitoxin module